MDLQKHWEEKVDKYENANPNYWLFHLQKHVESLSKRELDLYNLKNMDCFFQHNLLQKVEDDDFIENGIKDKESPEYIARHRFLNMSKIDKLEFFANKNNHIDDKYRMWRTVEQVSRRKMQKKEYEKHNNKKDKLNLDIISLLIA